nr:MAG TPA: hypothetical protein [Caudoviricetes sp.]
MISWLSGTVATLTAELIIQLVKARTEDSGSRPDGKHFR